MAGRAGATNTMRRYPDKPRWAAPRGLRRLVWHAGCRGIIALFFDPINTLSCFKFSSFLAVRVGSCACDARLLFRPVIAKITPLQFTPGCQTHRPWYLEASDHCE